MWLKEETKTCSCIPRAQIYSFLTAQKVVGIPIAESEKPDVVIQNFEEFLDWLDRENPAMALK